MAYKQESDGDVIAYCQEAKRPRWYEDMFKDLLNMCRSGKLKILANRRSSLEENYFTGRMVKLTVWYKFFYTHRLQLIVVSFRNNAVPR